MPFLIKLLGSLLPLVFPLVGAEFALRVIGADSYYKNQFFPVNRDIDFMDVYRRDPELFWRFRENRTINSDRFSNISYRINSRASAVPNRILTRSIFGYWRWGTRVVRLGVPWEQT